MQESELIEIILLTCPQLSVLSHPESPQGAVLGGGGCND